MQDHSISDEVAAELARRLLAELLCVPPSDIALDDRLLDELAMDSLEVLDLAMRLEEQWGILLDENQLRRLATVRDVATLLTRDGQRGSHARHQQAAACERNPLC
ncbi:acyl carrier protein [Burkholderia sp. ABCPW 14]|uniref:acyl carrier protein n=1 Tax=Burkholderia sp. ABCPW 14 TaxID=1637860 RepID=UPI0009EB45B3|nr:acyl carrier protein [Burkholderia sp. ABCPW 14]